MSTVFHYQYVYLTMFILPFMFILYSNIKKYIITLKSKGGLMDRIIKVVGTSKATIKADTTNIQLGFEEILPTYEEAISKSTETINKIKKALSALKIKKEDIKTRQFNIDTFYEYKNENDTRKKVFKGYRYYQQLVFSFKNDNELLGKILFSLVKHKLSSDMKIFFTCSEENNCSKKLIEDAIADAMNKGQIIEKASKVKIKEISNIDYSSLSSPVETSRYDLSRSVNDNAVMMSSSYNVDIQPEDIIKEDSVTVSFTIE